MYEYYIPSSLTSTIFLWKQMRDNGWEKRYVFSIKTLSTFHHRNNMQMHQGDKLERMGMLCLVVTMLFFWGFILIVIFFHNVTVLIWNLFLVLAITNIYFQPIKTSIFISWNILWYSIKNYLNILILLENKNRIRLIHCPWYPLFASNEKGKHICRPYIYFPLLISVPSIQSIYLRKTFTYIPSTMYSIAFSVYWK